MKLLYSALAALTLTVPLAAVSERTAEAPAPPCCREGLPPGKYSDQSLYRLNAVWTSDVGREIKLEVLRGRPQVIALFYLEDRPIAEIADILGMTPGTVKRHLYDGRRGLARRLREEAD